MIAGDAGIDDFRHRAAPEGKHRRAACHGLDHDQPERLRPVDRKEQRPRLAQKFALAALVDLSDELDARQVEQRHDLLAEIGFVDLVDLGGDLERDTQRLRDLEWRGRAPSPARCGRETRDSRRGAYR